MTLKSIANEGVNNSEFSFADELKIDEEKLVLGKKEEVENPEEKIDSVSIEDRDSQQFGMVSILGECSTPPRDKIVT